jgi:glycosyltransferase involved in cell wall biosynthesis
MTSDNIVSFVIPALNAQATIGRCLEGIAALDYPKDRIEVFVVDNGSKDDTVMIAKKFGASVLESDKKVSGMRNVGASKAKGEILAFVDADCVIPEDWLKAGIAYFDDNKVALVGSKAHQLPENATWVERTWNIHLDRDSNKATAKWFGTAAMLTRRDLFLEAGGFDENLATCEDVDLGYRLSKGHKIIADAELSYIHLGEDKTLYEFFRKEIWRGKSSLEVSFKNIREPKELLSLAVLVYYLALIFILTPLAAGALIISKNIAYLAAAGLAIILPFIVMAFDTCRKTGKFEYFGKLLIMYTLYIAARMAAIFK